jgi:transposase
MQGAQNAARAGDKSRPLADVLHAKTGHNHGPFESPHLQARLGGHKSAQEEQTMNNATITTGVAGNHQLLWSGLDVAKASFEVAIHHQAFADAKGRMMTREFPRTVDGVADLFTWVSEMTARLGQPMAPGFAMEATGNYSCELAKWLIARSPDCHVSILNPKQVKDYAQSLEMRNTTDVTAARAIARFATERNPLPYAPLDSTLEQLRQLVRERASIKHAIVAENNRAEEIPATPLIAKLQKKRVAHLEKDVEAIEKAMQQIVAQNPRLKADVALLRTIPGVGPIVSVTVLAEMGDLRRFARSRQLSAFAGLSPRLHNSGTSVHTPARMCKVGSPHVRAVLYMAAMVAVSRDNQLARFYRHLVEEGKTKMAALGAVMRKLLVLMRALLISETPYDDSHSPCGKLQANL